MASACVLGGKKPNQEGKKGGGKRNSRELTTKKKVGEKRDRCGLRVSPVVGLS